ncbi:MAG: hypothetical protein H6626_11235 [Pseudobdellovibrionaceae bacterium]|nr:hypothetical protein [Bdellovibrionales bacterium]USN46773.1 MAG: hypothetical protein H6626_11235 [Pseudobdellovibrionaceae bacterium]
MSLTKAFWIGAKREFSYGYPNKRQFAFQFLGDVIMLGIMWFTSQAFSPTFVGEGTLYQTYFAFVFSGYISFLIPSALLLRFTDAVTQSIQDETFFSIAHSKKGPAKVYSILGFSGLLFDLVRLITLLIIARLMFGFDLSVIQMTWWWTVQLLAVPLFWGLGLLTCGLVMNFGRGQGLMLSITNVLAVLSGVYFPVQVFGTSMEAILEKFSPFTVVINLSRASLSGFAGSEHLTSLFILGFGGGMVLVGGFYFFLWSFRRRNQVILDKLVYTHYE